MFTVISILLVIFFLLMNAFFVIAGIRSGTCSQIADRACRRREEARARAAKKIAENINAYLSACQLGITLASLAIGWLGEPAVSAVLEMPLLAAGLPESTIYPICVGVGFFIVTTLHVVVGELIPKSFAIFSTEKYALATGGSPRTLLQDHVSVHVAVQRHHQPRRACDWS